LKEEMLRRGIGILLHQDITVISVQFLSLTILGVVDKTKSILCQLSSNAQALSILREESGILQISGHS